MNGHSYHANYEPYLEEKWSLALGTNLAVALVTNVVWLPSEGKISILFFAIPLEIKKLFANLETYQPTPLKPIDFLQTYHIFILFKN